MQSSDEIIKEKQDSGKIKGDYKRGAKSKREQDLNVFTIRTNVKYWRKKSEMDAEYHQKFPRRIHPGGENITKNILYFGR